MGSKSDPGVARAVRDRRRHPRVPARFPVYFKIVDAVMSRRPYREGTTLDLARGGLRFETGEALQVGDCLALHLTLPEREEVVATLARVRRVRSVRSGAAHEVGVSFLWSGWHDAEMQHALAAFVRASLAVD